MVVVWWWCGGGVGWVLVRVVGVGFGYVVAWFGGGEESFRRSLSALIFLISDYIAVVC